MKSMTHPAADLLAAAFDELAELPTPEAVLLALPSLLSRFGESCVSVWVPNGDALMLVSAVELDLPPGSPLTWNGVVGRAVREQRAVYVPDVARAAGYVGLRGNGVRSHAELALPLCVRGRPVAVLNIEHADGLSENEVDRFTLFGRAVSSLLGQVQERERAAWAAQLAQDLPTFDDPATAVTAALTFLSREPSVGSAALLDYRAGRLSETARLGDLAPPLHAWPPEVLRAFKLGESVLDEDFALVPVAGRDRARRALWVAHARREPWAASDHTLLRTVARLLGATLERFDAQARLTSLLNLQRDLLSVPAEGLYRPLLQEAVRLVPGAEAGSLLVRVDDHFRYRAWVGFDDAELRDVSFSLADTRDLWYGLDEDAWQAGVPRVLAHGSILKQGIGYRVRNMPVESTLPSAAALQANLTVPILYGGEVYAQLNLDALHDPDAFGEDSVDAARSFAAQAAVLMHEARQRESIQVAARTDALTNLPNRRAFNESLERCVSGAVRGGTALSLLVIDLSGFKAVNDRLGHAAGDGVLINIAGAFRQILRGGDEVFRWGGDEFAVLLPATPEAGAVQVAQRLAKCVALQSRPDLPLSANIGVASGAGDSLRGEALLHHADAAMYRAKEAGSSHAVSAMS